MNSKPFGPGLHSTLHEGCGGDEIALDLPARSSRCHGVRSSRVSAGAAPGGSWPAGADACESAARAVAARCEAVSRSCCRLPAVRPAREANGRARDIRESNTALSNRADIASSSLAVRVNRRFRREERPVKQAGLCSRASSVSRKISTISRGVVSGPGKRRFGREFRARANSG